MLSYRLGTVNDLGVIGGLNQFSAAANLTLKMLSKTTKGNAHYSAIVKNRCKRSKYMYPFGLKRTDKHSPLTLDKIHVSMLWPEHIIYRDKRTEY